MSGISGTNRTYDGGTDDALAGTATLSSNYILGDRVSRVGTGIATLSGAGAGSEGVTVTGYSISGADAGDYDFAQPIVANVTISPEAITITADNQNATYGSVNLGTSAFSVTSGAVQPGDNISSVTLTAVDVNHLGTSGSGNDNVGTWAIAASAATGTGGFNSTNYDINYASGSLTIGRESQTILLGSIANQTYGSAPFTVSATASSNLAVSYSIAAGGQYASISGNTVTILGATPAGTVVTVEADQAGNAEYSAAPAVQQSFAIGAAILTITPASGQSMIYGSNVPILSYEATVAGDDARLFGGQLSTTATSTSNAGTYAFELGSLSAGPNYRLVLSGEAPSFAVAAATPVIASLTDLGSLEVFEVGTVNPVRIALGGPSAVLGNANNSALTWDVENATYFTRCEVTVSHDGDVVYESDQSAGSFDLQNATPGDYLLTLQGTPVASGVVGDYNAVTLTRSVVVTETVIPEPATGTMDIKPAIAYLNANSTASQPYFIFTLGPFGDATSIGFAPADETTFESTILETVKENGLVVDNILAALAQNAGGWAEAAWTGELAQGASIASALANNPLESDDSVETVSIMLARRQEQTVAPMAVVAQAPEPLPHDAEDVSDQAATENTPSWGWTILGVLAIPTAVILAGLGLRLVKKRQSRPE